MTAIDTNTIQEPETKTAFDNTVPVMITLAANWKARMILFRIVGAFFVVMAFTMWLSTGSAMAAEVWPIKLAASLLFLVAGVSLLTLEVMDHRPDAYFDPIRREVRVLQKNESGRPQTVLRRSYESLGGARFADDQVELFDVDGSLLMKLPLKSADVGRAIKGQLSGIVTMAA